MSPCDQTGPVMDPTLARLLGVIVARLRVDGFSPDFIAEWVYGVAVQIGEPQDADTMACPTCGQLVEHKQRG